jgi:hypothetical protein
MSRTRTLAAFVATVLVAVPAAWHALDADIQTDGPATRPKLQTLELDGATVTIELDRGMLKAGGQLKATLVATSDTPRTIKLDVTAWQNMGYGEERVENPARQAGKRTIKIDAAPGGGKPVDVAFTLGERGKKGVMSWFDVVVMQSGVKATEDYAPPSASVGAATWSGNTYAMKVEPPAKIPTDATFKVAVRVKNTTKKPVPWLEVDLGGATAMSFGDLESNLYLGNSDDAPFTVTRTEEEYSDEPLKPGEERVYTFDVTPLPTKLDGVTQYTLVAHAHGGYGGALDVVTLKAMPGTIATK